VSSKINGVDGGGAAAVGVGRGVKRSPDGAAGSASTAVSGDPSSVHITDTASQLASLEQALRDMPAVDSARVNNVRSAIEQGAYTVSPERIADRLMQMESALGGVADTGN
jgi:negative regulator of flagellin synthesis FlgM